MGVTLESAGKSSFWQWFQLQRAREENNAHRFQLNGPKYLSRCFLDVAVSPKNNEMQALTLSLQRSFINGPDEPFARELVRSFLCTVFFQQKTDEVTQLVNEVGTESGSQPSAEQVRPAHEKPSPPYLVFVGNGQRCALESGAFLLEMENLQNGSARWFYLRVRPRTALEKKRAEKSAPWSSSWGRPATQPPMAQR